MSGCSIVGVFSREVPMNGNPVYHALALAAASVLLLPLALAMLAGWAPPRLRDRAALRTYAWALLCLYVLAPLNAIPRMADAPAAVVTGCSAAGLAFVAAAATLLILTARRLSGLAHR
ncbi:hypothetical protein [Streptomyces sp. H34-S4]|uniref:hypothetical protein n=1 Tax=Streptomyces sp. H34-S4 TaxID=2996463 RepID=UPI0022703733|nr:hypothetical protein [Streptomyces sp. H34-S4]MCY0933871.1 hypothetical protein [Streptomyces sp. H34-S4]